MDNEIKIPVDKYGDRINYMISPEDHLVSISEYEKLFVSKILRYVKTFGAGSVADYYGLDTTTFEIVNKKGNKDE